ncbi:hypothetical protein ADU59_23000 [Pararhizobium polonicum]|uniref:Uncharacterized protein n=1 Tax=Pararhizobium polonicum TaxID=1612624 RepID=A0A1C7P0W9_9HYPH|nr:hypothetical protein [Pararhizobium polonicum]OBZ93314.1 hypothetical protein ADU59_23000 [Pararhizobium polonicum]
MIDWHDVILCFFAAAVASGGLLLSRFVYPLRFAFLLPNWRSAYIASSILFVVMFASLLLR